MRFFIDLSVIETLSFSLSLINHTYGFHFGNYSPLSNNFLCPTFCFTSYPKYPNFIIINHSGRNGPLLHNFPLAYFILKFSKNHVKYLIPSETFPGNIEILKVVPIFSKFSETIVLKVFSFGKKLAHKLCLLYSFKDLWRSINQIYQKYTHLKKTWAKLFKRW